MNEHILCLDSGGTNLLGLFDTTLAPSLLYYSYLPIIGLALILGTVVYLRRGQSGLANKLLFLVTIVFSFHLLNEILQWITVPAQFVHFQWQLITLKFSSMALLLYYFVYVFVNNRDLPFAQKLILTAIAVPILLFLPTSLNMPSFDLVWCEADIGPLFVLYSYVLSALIAVAVSFICIRRTLATGEKQHLLVMLGAVSFLFFLNISDLLGELLGDFEINLVGPIGMLVFLIVLSYLIVKFGAFNIKLLGAQALVVGLIVLIGSEFFFVETHVNIILVAVTFVLSMIGGYFLVRSVKKEVEQREQIAKLADSLAKANERLKILDKLKSEFVSIASHQLRSPLTSIRGYASMLVEGSYGKLPDKAQEAAVNIADSAKYMALSVEDYLNVSRIEAGNMKYEMSDFNLKETAERIVDELRPVAMKKGLVMVFRSDCAGSCSVHADIGKTRQVIMNIIDNSMKYTPKGTITVVAHDDVKAKKMYVTIEDTGIGMSKETQEEVFDKFVRAKNANSVNTTGTGLGLYVAKKMITAMKGRVWAESDGDGKGSRFHIELPLLPGKSMR